MTTWWSTDRINATISPEFIERELGPSAKNREALHRSLKFGDGLTDNTYLDCALERSPRLFLILNDIGYPSKIFDIIDRSFDDDDLPLTQEALWELNLFGTKSETLDKKFHRLQYSYIVQDLDPGGHVDYGPWDIVPVEPVVKKTQLSNAQTSDKVCAYEKAYTRKKVPSTGEDAIERIQFILHLRALVSIQDPHIVSIFATYAQEDFYYVLLTPSTDLTLKQIFSDESRQFKNLEKRDRREIVLTWAHCITSALAYLHDHGFDHKGIRLSTILVDENNKVYLSDYSALKALDFEDTTSGYNSEIYEYSPPENWVRKPCLHETAALKTVLPGGSRTSRRLPKSSAKLVEGRTRQPSIPSDSMNIGIASTNTGIPSTSTTTSLSRRGSKSASSSGSSSNPRPRNALITTFAPRRASASSLIIKEFSSDVFSMSAVLLTLVSYLLGHSPKSFASYRGKFNRQAGRGNAPPDISFHKNLKQVDSWMNKLVKDAGQKEKKDVKFWGAVAELVNVCRKGLNKDHGSRITAPELDKKVGGWVEWGLGRRRVCTCHDKEAAEKKAAEKKAASEQEKEAAEKEAKPRPRVRPPKRTSERISYINDAPARYWTTPSEDISDAFPTARNSYATWSSGPGNRGSQATEIGMASARNSFRHSIISRGIGRAYTDGAAPARFSRASSTRQQQSQQPQPQQQQQLRRTRDGITSGLYVNRDSMSVQRNSKDNTIMRPRSVTADSFMTQVTENTEVWGLDGALAEEDENVLGLGVTGAEDDDDDDDDDDDEGNEVRTELAHDEFDEVRTELANEEYDEYDDDGGSVTAAGGSGGAEETAWPLPMGKERFEVVNAF